MLALGGMGGVALPLHPSRIWGDLALLACLSGPKSASLRFYIMTIMRYCTAPNVQYQQVTRPYSHRGRRPCLFALHHSARSEPGACG